MTNQNTLPAPNPTLAAAQTSLTDIQEKARSQAQAPYPQPLDFDRAVRQMKVSRRMIAAGAAERIDVGFKPEKWIIQVRYGSTSDGYYVSSTGQSALDSLWQRADKVAKIPGFDSVLYIQSDADTTLEMYIIAVRHCDVDLG
jgi:hypothetical protein